MENNKSQRERSRSFNRSKKNISGEFSSTFSKKDDKNRFDRKTRNKGNFAERASKTDWSEKPKKFGENNRKFSSDKPGNFGDRDRKFSSDRPRSFGDKERKFSSDKPKSFGDRDRKFNSDRPRSFGDKERKFSSDRPKSFGQKDRNFNSDRKNNFSKNHVEKFENKYSTNESQNYKNSAYYAQSNHDKQKLRNEEEMKRRNEKINENIEENKENSIIEEVLSETDQSISSLTSQLESLTKQINTLNKKLEIKTSSEINLLEQNLKFKNEIDELNQAYISRTKDLTEKASAQIAEQKLKNDKLVKEELKNVKLYGNQRFFETLLPLFTNYDLAVNAGIENENSVVVNFARGFDMLSKQMMNIFEESGVQRIIVELNSEFNPELHHAVSAEVAEKENVIIKVISNGYKLHDRVIIPAKVIVSKLV